jgi:hypothetical protein
LKFDEEDQSSLQQFSWKLSTGFRHLFGEQLAAV